MSLFRRTRTAAYCAAASAALILGMAGTTIAFSDPGCVRVGCDELALYADSPVPTTPRTASTPEPPAVPSTGTPVTTARTPTP